jgi:hypothetical protein
MHVGALVSVGRALWPVFGPVIRWLFSWCAGSAPAPAASSWTLPLAFQYRAVHRDEGVAFFESHPGWHEGSVALGILESSPDTEAHCEPVAERVLTLMRRHPNHFVFVKMGVPD